jgi:eukaryotic-like serine/threonine-protein kinase
MQQLGKYTVLRRLGVGGMAEVFLCKLVGIGGFEKHVVVKKIKADIASDDEFITMFFDEARLAANLNHPNIIQVFEVDHVEGTPYLAMEYVRGSTLSALLQKVRASKQPMNVGHLAFIFSGVCAGLDHAHNAKDAGGRPLTIVHRDISPTNIIISVDGTPKIFDFGVAKARGSLSLTGVDRVKGKFAYMAPEQLRAKPVDAKADIFAVGVCMYEAITGRRPFAGATEAELYAARLEGRFIMPSELAPTIPVELEHMILSAMAPDPADRPHAIELQEQLAMLCGPGTEHASNALAVAQYLKDMVGEQVEAFEKYSSSSPSMTPLPRSANMPRTTSAVEARSRRTGRGTLVASGMLAAAAGLLAAVLVVVLVKRQAAPMQVSAAEPVPAAESAQAANAQPPSTAQAAAQAEEATRREQQRELQHQHDLAAMRSKLDEAEASRARAELPQRAAAALPRAERTVEREPERKADKAKARATKLAVTKAAGSAESPGARDGSSASNAGSGSGGSGSAQVAAQAPQERAAAPPGVGSGSGSATARPAPPPAKIMVAPVAPAIAKPGTFDAVPAISKLSVEGSLTTTEVQAALARTVDALRTCYRGAAKKANQTPEVSVKVSFEIDEGARATSVRVSSDTFGVGACVKDAIGGMRTRVAPDVGTVSVSAVVRFKPTH